MDGWIQSIVSSIQYIVKCICLCVLAGDDAKIRVWQVPEGGLKETLTEPELVMQGRTEPVRLTLGSSHCGLT